MRCHGLPCHASQLNLGKREDEEVSSFFLYMRYCIAYARIRSQQHTQCIAYIVKPHNYTLHTRPDNFLSRFLFGFLSPGDLLILIDQTRCTCVGGSTVIGRCLIGWFRWQICCQLWLWFGCLFFAYFCGGGSYHSCRREAWCSEARIRISLMLGDFRAMAMTA